MTTTPNHKFRAARDRLKLSQDEMAMELRRLGAPASCTKRLVQRWESGVTAWPTAAYRRALTTLTKLSAQQLGFRAPAAAHEDDLDPMYRRTLLTSVAFLAAAGAIEPYARLQHALARPGRPLTRADAEHLLADTDTFFTREATETAAALAPDLARHLGLVTALLTLAADESVRRTLVLAAGTTAALAGWCAMDTGDQASADGYWAAAVSAAKESGDGPLLSLVMAYLSYQHAGRGDHAGAWELLDAAGRHVRSRADAQARSWIAARQAEEAAALGQGAPALVALERAMTAHDYIDTTSPRAWVDFFDGARLGSMAVATYGRLQHPQLGQAADAVMDSLGPDMLKTRAVILGDVAGARLAAGNLDEGCAIARQALAATVSGEAILGRERLAALLPALTAHQDAAEARALRADLAAAGITG